jgi:hypothetical protein
MMYLCFVNQLIPDLLGHAINPGPARPRNHAARWPSGLRRCVKAAVRKGVGSNPTLVIYFQ